MALGGGIWTAMDKKLPGSYINFVNAVTASSDISERGTAAYGASFDWAPSGLFLVEAEEFRTNSLKVFAHASDSDAMKTVRELFKHAQRVYFYNLNEGGSAASNEYATAAKIGSRGNDIKIAITAETDSTYTVKTCIDSMVIDTQKVTSAKDLVANNYVTFKTDAKLAATAGMALTGGADGSTTTASHMAFLAALESVSFNTLGCSSTDKTVVGSYISFTKRMRDDIGRKFQLVVPYIDGVNPDNEGIIQSSQASLVPWLTGAEAGCTVKSTLTNAVYDGDVLTASDIAITQAELVQNTARGELSFHRVEDGVRILTDINSLTTYTSQKSFAFSANQTIRVLDQIGNDVAAIFNTNYIGFAPNNETGRLAFWNSLVQYLKDLQTAGAIQGFTSGDVTVGKGNSEKDVTVEITVTPVNAFEKLYMTVYVAQ